ncbi:Putative ribonuclease H protein At1g65750 [Linum perenne]
MLGKQGWKFLKDPDALATRVFKARYFPDEDFLSAPLGNGPSYAWQSIRETQELLARGVRWRVGDGTKISVWGDNWLKNENNPQVSTPPEATLQGLVVCDLRIPGVLEWEVELIEGLFDERDVEEILKLPIGVGGTDDKLIWNFEKTGICSVRSTYGVYLDHVNHKPKLNIQGPWRSVWNLHVPPKVKHLVWRLGREVVPSRTILRHRHIAVPSSCGVCGLHEENYQHLFLTCNYATDCWRSADIYTMVRDLMAQHNSFATWLDGMLSSPHAHFKETCSTVLWDLWHERNRRVWSREALAADVAAKLSLDDLMAWQ